MTAARNHTDQIERTTGKDTGLYTDVSESMVELPAFDGCNHDDTVSIILPGPLADPVPRVLSRSAEDLSYMSPEMVAAKLKELYREPHYCRSVGCGNQVAHCGDHCPRCTSEIDALRKDYAEQGRKASRVGWAAIVIVCVFVCALLAGCWWLGQALRGWL